MVRRTDAGDGNEFAYTGEIRRYRNSLRMLTAGITIGVVIGALGMHTVTVLRERRNAPRPAQPAFTHTELSRMLGAVEESGEFALLTFMRDRDGKDADTTGLLGIYHDIMASNDRTMKVEEGLEKVYYLSVHRAESAKRRGDLHDAIKHYRLAEKIKPDSREVARGLLVTRDELSGFKKRTLASERTNESVFRVIRSKMSSVKRIYDDIKKRDAGISGKITLSFTVAPSGRVIKAAVVSSTVNCPALEKHLLTEFRAWDFGRVSSGAGPLSLNYPFVFY